MQVCLFLRGISGQNISGNFLNGDGIMKLSVSINFFNGEELLINTILNIRPLVDHLSLVYQTKSNLNNPISASALCLIDDLKYRKLVDDFFCYIPDFNIAPAQNEFLKRKIGLELAVKYGATHFLIMDTDEFYDQGQFVNAKKIIEQENITYSCVHSYFYLRKPVYRSEQPDTTNICFISKITPELAFEYNQEFPIENVDPTRRIVNTSGQFRLFNADEIVMHHMNFVRQNFGSKLANTSSAINSSYINEARDVILTWKFPELFQFPNKPQYNIIEVEDKFNLNGIFIENKLLITNHFLKEFTGSEIAVYDIAKEFIRRGFSVYIGSFKYEYPLKKFFDELGCYYIDLNKLGKNDSDFFDIIWLQHFTTADKIFTESNISAKYIIFSSLSPYEPLESPPLFSDKINIFLANSHETKKKLVSMGLTEESIYVLPNPVSDDFFMVKYKAKIKPQKIAVVSNHAPCEIREAESYLKDNGFDVVQYGMDGVFELITPAILEQYDAVITIGRTVQYCLAIGLPVYCYDRYGGPGWINRLNIEKAAEFNFSGRCSNRKLTFEEIVLEIKDNYDFAKSDVVYNQEFAENNYRLSTHIAIILENIKTYSVKYTEYLYRNVALRQKEYLISSLPIKHFIQLFIDNKNGFLEETSFNFLVMQNSDLQSFEFELSNRHNSLAVRLDILNDSCIVELAEMYIKKENSKFDLMPHIQSNADIKEGNVYFFSTEDPQIHFHVSETPIFNNVDTLCVSIKYLHMSDEALRIIIEKKNKELSDIYNSTSWKIVKLLKKLKIK